MWLARLKSFAAAFVTNRRLERDMDEEWRFHIDARADAIERGGVPRVEALKRARIEFGDPLRWKESGREARGVLVLYDIVADLRYGLRQLRRAPLFAATAVVTLALGIGANTLAFSILHAVLVRPLPFPAADRVVLVWFAPPGNPAVRGGATLQNYFAVRDRSRAFESVGSASASAASIAVNPDDVAGAEPVNGQRIHATLPAVLGIRPILGQWFTDADDPPTAARKVVLSHVLWQQRFGSDPGVIGRTIRMDAVDTIVVGVMPEGFEVLDAGAQFWTPSRWSEATMTSPSRMLVVAARLKPDVTLAQAQGEMDVLAGDLASEFPPTNQGWTIHLESLFDAYTLESRRPLLLLQGVVALVLLIACANVAGLLLARASARRQEFAMRLALGASPARLARQLLTESLLLSALGGAGGVGLAFVGVRLFMAQNPAAWLPRAAGVSLDVRVLAFALIASVASGVLFGLLPSWTVSRSALITAIRGATAGRRLSHQQLRGVLVAGQVAVALVLLIAAGLLVNTMVRLTHNRPDIDPTNLLAFQVRLSVSEMVTPTGRDAQGFFGMTFSPRVSLIFRDIQERLSAVPGVTSATASLSAAAMPTRAWYRLRVTAAGQPTAVEGTLEPPGWLPVSTHYFSTLGIPVRRGREFVTSDSLASTPVAVVNDTLARRLWPGEDPIGRELMIDFVNDRPRQVIGVVADVREYSAQRDIAPLVYVPDAQLPLASRGWFQSPRLTMTYFVRTKREPLALIGQLRSAVAEVYKNQPIYNIRTLETAMSEELTFWRQFLLLLGAFAGIAAVLTLVGIYGLVAYGVGQRTPEIGIRRALGANAGVILRLVLRQGFTLTVIGVGVGLLASLGLTRVLTSVLWGVSPTDPLTFALVATGLALVSLLACYLPARRALTINPTVALRAE